MPRFIDWGDSLISVKRTLTRGAATHGGLHNRSLQAAPLGAILPSQQERPTGSPTNFVTGICPLGYDQYCSHSRSRVGEESASDPDPFPRAQSSCARRAAPSSRRPPTCPRRPLSARLPSPPAPRRASQPAAAVAATVRRVAWPPRARSLPCSPARARAVPSARHASQPETVLPRGCPARGDRGCGPGWPAGSAAGGSLLAARRSRAGSC